MSGNQTTAPSGNSSMRPKEAMRKALDALHSGRLDEAQTLARAAVDAEPKRDEAWQVLAAVAQRQGRLGDAVLILKDGIGANPQSATLFVMLGLMLRDGGRVEDAETALRHAIELRPEQTDAAFNLGNMLASNGRLHEAEDVFRKAGAADPTDARFPLQIGRVMLSVGNRQQALPAFETATKLSRDALARGGAAPQDPTTYLEAAGHLATLLIETGESLKALDYLYDGVQLGGDESVRRQFAQCVATLQFADHQPLLKPLLVRALSEAWIEPEGLMRRAADQLMLDPEFSAPAGRVARIPADAEAPLMSEDVRKIASDPLLRAMMTSAVITDEPVERLLTGLRRRLIEARLAPDAPAARGSEGLLAFAVALANQCFTNDYAYALSTEENEMADRLAARISEAAAANDTIALSDLAALASYRPLHGLDRAAALLQRQWPPALKPLIQMQLSEPQTEAGLRQNISHITPIADDAGHQDSPAPRWMLASVRTQRTPAAMWLKTHFPDVPTPAERFLDPQSPVEVLEAGCATGQETVAFATRFANCEVLAVDRSLANLAYAERKTDEIGLKNISYAQADILELDGLGRQFDFVVSAGVLDRLPDPAAGLKALSSLTRPGGYLLVALQSKHGYRDLDPVRAFIAENGYGTSDEDLRRFRSDAMALPDSHPVHQFARGRDEFYDLAMLRALLFRGQAHRFTVPEIGEMLAAQNLEFCGFAVEPDTRKAFAEQFGPQCDFLSLNKWEKFEDANPDTFSAMYHMLVKKPG